VISEDLLEKIIEFAQKLYTEDDLHGIGHIERVLQNAIKIAKMEGGNLNLTKALVWLHDIGRIQEKDKHTHHTAISVELSQKFLSEEQVDAEIIEILINGIYAHSFSLGHLPQSLEAKILSDADKLDAIGAIGIFRASAYQFQHKTGINGLLKHIDKKLLKINDRLFTNYGKSLAGSRIDYLIRFKEKILYELKSADSFDPEAEARKIEMMKDLGKLVHVRKK
jgi:uncharacterized protein